MKLSWGLAGLLLVGGTLGAQSGPPPPPEARQFDFWLGDWDVTQPDGKNAGRNHIEKIGAGWGLLENWTGAGGGGVGKSLNTWLPDRKQWRQFWVGNGGALELIGGLNDRGEMVLAGTTATPAGGTQLERITWTPNADGTVRQHWQQSADGGVTWTTAFDGLYRRSPR
jgi:hypothetical protein